MEDAPCPTLRLRRRWWRERGRPRPTLVKRLPGGFDGLEQLRHGFRIKRTAPPLAVFDQLLGLPDLEHLCTVQSGDALDPSATDGRPRLADQQDRGPSALGTEARLVHLDSAAGLDQADDLVQLQEGVLLRTQRIGLPEHLLVLAGVSEVRVKGVEAAGAGRSRNRVTGGVRSGEAARFRPSPTRFPEDVPVGGAEPKIAVAGDSDAPGAQAEDAAGEERRISHSEPPVEHLCHGVRRRVLGAQQLDLELEHGPDRIRRSAGEAAVTAVARLLEAPEAPQGLDQDQLVGRPSDSSDRIPVAQRLLPELDGTLPAARGVLVLTLGLAAPGAEQRAPAGGGVPGLGLGVAAEPGINRRVAISVRGSHAEIGSGPNVPSDAVANFLRLSGDPLGRTASLEEETA